MVKVLDFGISKTTDRASSGLTKTSAVMGSPCYMSPEQMRSSKDVDARSDIWALGVILYQMVTGALPFSGESLPEIVCQVTQGEMRPIRDLRPDVPEGLVETIGRCLRREPAHRFANVAELAGALAPFSPAQAGVSLPRICRILEVGEEAAPSLTAPETPKEAQSAPSLINAAVSEGARSNVSSHRGRRLGFWVGLGAVLSAVAAVTAWQAAKRTGPPGDTRGSGSSLPVATAPSVLPGSPQPAPSVSAETVPSLVDASPMLAARQTAPDAANPSVVVEPVKPAEPAVPAVRSPPTGRKRAPPPVPSAPVNRGLNMELKE